MGGGLGIGDGGAGGQTFFSSQLLNPVFEVLLSRYFFTAFQTLTSWPTVGSHGGFHPARETPKFEFKPHCGLKCFTVAHSCCHYLPHSCQPLLPLPLFASLRRLRISFSGGQSAEVGRKSWPLKLFPPTFRALSRLPFPYRACPRHPNPPVRPRLRSPRSMVPRSFNITGGLCVLW